MKTPVRFSVAILALSIGISAWLLFPFGDSERGKMFDKWEVSTTKFKLRIIAYKEKAAFALPGAYYVFHSAALNSDDWREITTIRTDEPHPIPRQQIRFVDEHTGYIFLSNYYMVTIDSGHTWSIWDAGQSLPDPQYRRQYNLSSAIKLVEVQPDGSGRMVLYPLSDQREKGPDLYTTDYGQHWK